MKNLKLLSLILAFAGAVLGQAQTAPPAINYQGRLTQATGVVVPDGLTGMRIRIFDSASGGSLLWDSNDLSVATKSGTFSILLGSGGMPAMSPSVFALGSVYIEVQPTGQAPLLPRQPISTVPWAFYAQTVSDGAITTPKLGDLQVTLAKLAQNSVSTLKIVDQAVTSVKLASDGASLVKVSGGAMQANGTLIGIGTSPAHKLHVRGNQADLRVSIQNDSGREFQFISTGAGSGVAAGSLRIFDASGSADRLTISPIGRIGIGTTNPQATLDVLGGFNVSSGATVSGGGMDVTGTTILRGGVELFGPTPFLDFHHGNSSADYTARIITNPTGISIEGDISTWNKLSLFGTGGQIGLDMATNDRYANMRVIQNVSGPDNDLYLNFGVPVNGKIHLFSGGSETMTVTGGRVGVGTTSPTHRLTLPNTADVNGQARANAWTTYSSKRWKEDIRPIEDPLALLGRLTGVRFKWKVAQGGQQDIGLIAEDVAKVLPEIVSFDSSGRADGMSYDRLVALLLEGTKAQQEEIESLRRTVISLKAENKQIREEMSGIWTELKKRR